MAASADTEKENVVGWSLLYKNRNLAKIIRAEIHSVRIVKGVDIESDIVLKQERVSCV